MTRPDPASTLLRQAQRGLDPLPCAYYTAAECRSCTMLGMSHQDQIASKQARAHALLDAYAAPGGCVWEDPVHHRSSGFRNKAKMVVGGTSTAPTLGILDRARRPVDLRHCALIDPRIEQAFEAVTAMITACGLAPYDVPQRSGELKNVLITVNPDGELMVRFVVRSEQSVPALRAALPVLTEQLPHVRVVSVNVLPEHKAVLEGEQEWVLTPESTLPMRLPSLTLELGVKSFFQTNSEIAADMYQQAVHWAQEVGAQHAWDLYCGVGGFALALTAVVESIVGVEVSAEAVAAAQRTAQNAGLNGVTFVAADARQWAGQQDCVPDLVVVNPPRRGLGSELARVLQDLDARRVLYSSCQAATLAQDLAVMTSWRIERARIFDMFPQSDHYEVMVLLTREDPNS
ncbi:23S rRNA (uracil(1939)-C(5))-methyltransferase RlmD [Dermatophilus congolensis]|nr:23S rRNA (uracil(1939)-C(5))-methyltransferase RlmD [Dermatophilus congolensis]